MGLRAPPIELGIQTGGLGQEVIYPLMDGQVLALMAGVSLAGFQILHRRVGSFIHPSLGSFVLILVSFALLGAASLASPPFMIVSRWSWMGFAAFAAAGVIHFLFGWSLLTLSQRRVGAARTGSILGTSPALTSLLAVFILGQLLSPGQVLGIILVMAGVWLVASDSTQPSREAVDWRGRRQPDRGLRDSGYALATALCFAVSAILVRIGLSAYPSALLGSVIGLGVSTVAYGTYFLIAALRPGSVWFAESKTPSKILLLQALAAIFLALATLMQYAATATVPTGVVVALGRVSVPLVVLLSPVLLGRHVEPLSGKLLLGAGLVLLGALMLTH